MYCGKQITVVVRAQGLQREIDIVEAGRESGTVMVRNLQALEGAR